MRGTHRSGVLPGGLTSIRELRPGSIVAHDSLYSVRGRGGVGDWGRVRALGKESDLA